MSRSRVVDGSGVAITLLFWVTVLVVRPWRDFPLNDDWAYGEAVRYWMSQGYLRLSTWSPVSVLAHAAWGRLFCSFNGFSYGWLRLSTLTLGWAGLLAFHRSLLRLGAPPANALAGALLLLFNPLFFSTSMSFMTDVPALAWMLISAHFFLIAELDDDARFVWLGSAVSGLAYLVRQTGACTAIGAAAWSLARGKRSPRALISILAGPVIAFSLQALWMAHHGVGLGFHHHAIMGGWARLWHEPRLMHDCMERLEGAAFHLALFLFPMAVACDFQLRRAIRARWPFFAAAGAIACAAVLFQWVPTTGNVISRFGLGVCSVAGCDVKAAGWFGDSVFWTIIEVAAVASGALIVLNLPLPYAATGLYASGFIGAFLLSLAAPNYYDRYFLVLFPAAIAGLMSCSISWKRFAPALAALASWSVLGTWDYLNWNGARWEGGRRLVAMGIPPSAVCGGLEWNGVYNYEPLTRDPLRPPPRYPSEPFLEARYVAFISFENDSWAGTLKQVGVVPYFCPLTFRAESLHLWLDPTGKQWRWRL